ncbi:hypothetical protein BC834DRAFT_840454 [Gloeopeniophorella convolvens]|nr:hypothetical protein BC834DRAFT_840454 [Gloeopeniophorella convolvens]
MPPIPILAPQPRRLVPQPTIIDPSEPVLPINLDDPFICRTPAPKNAQLPRLMSPIRLHHRTKRALTSQSPTPCSSVKCAPRTPRRRRHHIRPDTMFPSRVINFDSLPWISALDDPVTTAGNVWDSDLSQLASAERVRANGAGPVRRRKSTTLSRDRAEPLAPLVSPPPDAASTPPPRFPSPQRVKFIGLMPAMTPIRPSSPLQW